MHSEAQLTNLTQKVTKVCDLLTWSDFTKILHKALLIGKVQRQTRADKILALQKL